MTTADGAKNGGGGRVRAARLAQGLAGGLTAWAILLHLLDLPHASLLLLAFSAAALVLTFKKAASLRLRAFYCFTAAGLVNGLVILDVALAVFTGILNGTWRGSFGIPLEKLLLVAAAVLYSFAGAFFWLASAPSDATSTPTDEA